jgi:hypothetical protein
MGFLGSITDRVSNAVSTTINKVEDKAASAVDSVKSTVVQAEQKVETFAKSEYETVKNYAQVTGQAVVKKAEAAVDAGVKEVKSFKVPQGVSAPLHNLYDKVVGKPPESSADVKEGGVDMKRANSGKPEEVVNLSDKSKIQDFLNTYGQKDQNADTNSDGARCQSNVMVAGMLMKGGTPGLITGLKNAKVEAEKELSTATGGRKLALEASIKNLTTAVQHLDAGTATRGDLDHAADALFHTMAKTATYNDKGEVTTSGIEHKNIQAMEKTLGLTGGEEAKEVGEYSTLNPMQLYYGNDEEVANKTWESIQPGQTAHVGVNLYGEHLANGAGPEGEKIEKSSSGKLFYQPKGTSAVSDRVYVRSNEQGGINHAVLFGKNQDGTRYIYNPLGDPPYTTEKKGDSKSTDALDKLAASLMAQKKFGKVTDDYHSQVTTY